jgi:hypothetical protein
VNERAQSFNFRALNVFVGPDKPTSDAADDDLKDRNDLHVLHRVSAKTLATSYTVHHSARDIRVQDDHLVGGVNESAQSFNFRALDVLVGLVEAYFVQGHDRVLTTGASQPPCIATKSGTSNVQRGAMRLER